MPISDSAITPGEEYDGYKIIRFLGRGGFGEVWLCRSQTTGHYYAIKFISGRDADLLEKEHHSLGLYRSAAARLRSPHLVSIEHINRHDAGIYYLMPLADGITDVDPTDSDWQPLSLASLIDARGSAGAWFTSQEIIGLIHPILDALQSLSDAGLVHRDVKPENILFFSGSPCLGDISLLGEDAAVITRRGTPGYATPSWYRGGHPDMYGVVATLYTLLTGNPPDRMGKSTFLWPPQGEHYLPESELTEWKRLHAVIRRATDEKVGERYVDFRTMAAALDAVQTAALPQPPANPPPLPSSRKKSHSSLVVTVVVLVIAAIGTVAVIYQPPSVTGNNPETQVNPPPEILPSAPVTQRPPKIVNMRGHFRAVREKVIESLPVAISVPSDGTVRLDLDEYAQTHAILEAYKSRDYKKCLAQLNERMAAHPELGKTRLFILTRALVLKHLDRAEEVETLMRQIEPPPSPDRLFDLPIELILLESLGQFPIAENLVSTVIKVMPKKATTSDKINLYNLRARYRILTGNYAGALADEHTALDLPPEATPNRPESKQEIDQLHLNTIVMQWELLEQEFPPYAAYLEANGWPEPKPDHRKYKAED